MKKGLYSNTGKSTLLFLFIMTFIGCQKDKEVKIIDGDGNEYHSVIIGDQTWLKENLMTTKFNNGDPIAEGIFAPNGNSINVAIYGNLYTWTVVTDNRKICPSGWHVPSQEDWNILLSNLTSPADLKEAGYSHWLPPNTLATDLVSFSALPAGYFTSDEYLGINETAAYWFTDEIDLTTAKGFRLFHDNSPTTGDMIHALKQNAFSVRCLKD